MKDLNYQLSKLCRDNRDGGFSTQATRSRILDLIANQLLALGFRRMQATSLKPKHVDALLAHWREQGICDFNRSMQHLISYYREEDVANEVQIEDLLQRRAEKLYREGRESARSGHHWSFNGSLSAIRNWLSTYS